MFRLKIQLHGGVVKFVKRVFGGSDDSSYDSGYAAGQAQATKNVTVAPSTISSSDTDGDTGVSSSAKARRKKGFASTISSPTLMSSSTDSARNTLG